LEAAELFTPQFLKKLKLLQILSKKVNWGSQKGEHTSTQRGRSLEFKDFRNYCMGDDIRYIDWNIYGRLDRLFMKLFVEELELTLYLLIDASLSMSLGEPAKLLYAKKIAACLSFIALSNFDRAGIAAMDESVRLYQPPMRGTNMIFGCFDFLDRVVPQGKTHLGKALRDFGKRKQRPGLVVILSDFLQEQDFLEGLNLLHYQKNQLFLIQILDRKEIAPDLRGDLKLVDVETGDSREISMSDRLMQTYQLALSSYCTRIEEHCTRRGIGYLQTTTDMPFEEIILKYLRMGRLLA
jgi:uncharacterized protein (DUF58 family)